MDKIQALHSFWSSFGIPAIDEQSAYDDKTLNELNITFPYITYEVAQDSFNYPAAIGADLWYQSTSWSAITAKAQQIEAEIGRGGKIVRYDGGAIWITRASPFSQRLAAENDYDVRRVHININAEFLSA